MGFPFRIYKIVIQLKRSKKQNKKLEKEISAEKIIDFSKGERNVSLADHLIIFYSMFFSYY